MNTGTIFIWLSLAINVVLFIYLCFKIFKKSENKKILYIAYLASGLALAVSVILLFTAFISGRFDISYVYNYSSRDLPLFFKIAAFWAGQEGTFLLWSFILFILGLFELKDENKYRNIVISVITLTQIFILILLVKQSPFGYISGGSLPPDGAGLNPLLQDPWMIIHPPVLFLGYASSSMFFAYAIAGLLMRDYSGWAEKAYKWVLFCMTFLGIGIFMGGYWAYKVLGWGGYWGWDPVENSSLIPWLTTVALMHGLLLQRRNKVLVKSNFFLSMLTLVLVFYGTFLTRSGILSDFSVHSFSDLGLKIYLVIYIMIFLIIGFGLLIYRAKDINSRHTQKLDKKFFTGTNTLNYGIILLTLFTALVLLGTSMPVLSGLFSTRPANVTQDFYSTLLIPFGILILLSLIAASAFRWQKNIVHIIILLVLSLILAILINLLFSFDIKSMIFCGLGIFIVLQNIYYISMEKSRVRLSSRLSHIGIGILAVGIITSNIHSYSIQNKTIKNAETEFGPFKLTFLGIDNKAGSLKFTYKKNTKEKEIKTPYYFNKKMNSWVKEPFIDYGIIEDIYISPMDYREDSGSEIILSKSEEQIINGVKIKFIGFEISDMTSENPTLYAKLSATENGREYVIEPGLKIKDKNNRKNIDVKIPGTGNLITLKDFDIAEKKILISFTPEERKSIRSFAVIDVAFKRLVWLVWLGTIFIAAGGLAGLKKKR